MKIVITGATGFIGRNLAERFHEEGLDVVATGRSEQAGEELKKRGIAFKKADLLDKDGLSEVLSGAGVVIHSAGKSADWGREDDFFQVNVMGTRHVIHACKAHQIKKIIFISTPSIYFTGKDRFDIKEDDPLPEKQYTAYARTKALAEKELKALQKEGFQLMIFRPRAVYGPYDKTILPRILMMAEKKKFPLINGGSAITDITYIENFIDAVRAGISAPQEAWNEIYNISNGEPVRVREWFAMVLELLGLPFNPKHVPEPLAKMAALSMELKSSLPFGDKKPSLTRFSVGYMARSMTMSIANAKSKLQYAPRFGNRQGYEQFVQQL